MKKIQTVGFESIDDLRESQLQDSLEFIEYLEKACTYLLSQQWCETIKQVSLAQGWPGILAICYVEIAPLFDADRFVWVIVGDLPTAYIDIESATSPHEVLLSYTLMLEDWVDVVETGKPLNDVFPIEVAANRKNSSLLRKRIVFIKNKLLPLCNG